MFEVVPPFIDAPTCRAATHNHPQAFYPPNPNPNSLTQKQTRGACPLIIYILGFGQCALYVWIDFVFKPNIHSH